MEKSSFRNGGPFVQLFGTPNANYIYDVSQSRLLNVQKETYRYVENLLRGDVDTQVPLEVEELRAQGYLKAESPVKEIKHPYTDVVSTLLERKLNLMTLQLTQQCNFRCKYCVYSENLNARQRSHSDATMSLEVAKRAIDFLWEHSVDSEGVAIGLYGGEPLLQFPLVRSIVEYSKKRFFGKNLTFSMTTNGSLLSDEIVSFLEENDVSLLISMDGPKEINDRNRVFRNGTGTFDVVARNLQSMKSKFPEYWSKVRISMVIDTNNDLDEVGKIISELGIEPSKLKPSLIDCEYDNLPTTMTNEYYCKQEYHRFLSYLAHWNRYPTGKVSPILQSRVETTIENRDQIFQKAPLREYDSPSGPCVPGQLRLLVDVNGNFYPCERVSETSDVAHIGSLDNGFDLDKVQRFLNASRVTRDVCINCWCFRFCNQCGKRADSGGSELDAQSKLKYCAATRRAALFEIENYLLTSEIPMYYKDFVEV